jgi:hypothetical protein
VTANDIVGIALSLAVAALAGFALVATVYVGGKALIETIVDGWRLLKVHVDTQRRWREEMAEEAARRMAR